MFNRTLRKRLADAEKALHEARRSKEAIDNYSHLIGIEREGRLTKFKFVRNGRLIEIETMGLISDNLPQWKKDLLE